MNELMKKRRFLAIVFLIAAIVCVAAFSAADKAAYADPEANLPFTLVAPKNVTLTKENSDSSTTMGYAYGFTNEMVDFFDGYQNASVAGTLAEYLQSKGVDYADEMWLNIQIDWALDDVNDEVSGWHYNEYWEQAALGVLGTGEDGKYHYSAWEIVDEGVKDATVAVNNVWLYGGINDGQWLGHEDDVGLREQLRSTQYTFASYEEDGDVNLYIDWTKHTLYNRSRFVVVLRDNESNEDSFIFSDWSAVCAYGKDAANVEPLKPGDVVAPTITGLRMTDEQFNDNPVVAFTLTVPDSVAEQKACVAAANGTFRVEVEARVKGTTEWKNLNVAEDVTTGELKAALIYLAEPGKSVAAGTEIELRARYLVGQSGRDDFYSAYSKVIGFGSDDIVITDTPAVDTTGDDTEGSLIENILPKSSCPICHFCPQPLGLCVFIWLVIIAVVVIVVIIVIKIVKKKQKNSKK